MSLYVEDIRTASTGKSLRVKLAGKWYGAAFDSGLAAMKGKHIVVEITTIDCGPWIKKWAQKKEPDAVLSDREFERAQYWKWTETEANKVKEN